MRQGPFTVIQGWKTALYKDPETGEIIGVRLLKKTDTEYQVTPALKRDGTFVKWVDSSTLFEMA